MQVSDGFMDEQKAYLENAKPLDVKYADTIFQGTIVWPAYTWERALTTEEIAAAEAHMTDPTVPLPSGFTRIG